MRKLTVSGILLVVLLISAVLFGPGFVDWNKYKTEITDRVFSSTGRELVINGDVNLRILPIPSFSANDVTFANTPNSNQPFMLSLEELGVKIAILPLLSGVVRVQEVTLRKPVIFAEKFLDGKGNWEFTSVEAQKNNEVPTSTSIPSVAKEEITKEDDFFQSVSLDQFHVIDGTLTYIDHTKKIEEKFKNINAEVIAGSLNGPFTLAGDLVLKGQHTEIELDIGQIVDQGATAINVGVRLPDSQAKLKFTGFLSQHVNSTSYRGTFEGDGKDLGSLISELSGKNIKTKADSDFELSAALEGDQTSLSLGGINFRVGFQNLSGDVKVDLKDNPKIELVLASPRVNLDEILADAQQGDSTTVPTKIDTIPSVKTQALNSTPIPPEESSNKATWPDLPKNLSVNAQFQISDIIYNSQIIRDFSIVTNLNNGTLSLEKLSAFLPSGGQLSMLGNYTDKTITGQVTARTEDLRGLLNWLKVDVPSVPNDRLRRLESKTKFSITPEQVVLNPISLTLDVSHLDGAVTVALRDRLGIGARLVVDRLDLDAYKLVETKANKTPSPVGDQSNSASVSGEKGTNNQPLTSAKDVKSENPLAILNDFDANVDLTVGEILYRKVPFKGGRFDGTLQQGGLSVRNASIDDVIGSSAALSGSFAEIVKNPKMDATIIARIADLSKLLIATGDIEKDTIPDFGVIDVNGKLKGTSEDLAVDLTGTILGGSYQARGQVRPTGTKIYEGLVSIDHPNAAQLVRSLNKDAGVNGKWGRLTAKAMVKADLGQVELAELDGSIAGTSVQGSVLTKLTGHKPQVTVNLITGALNLNNLLPADPKGGASGGASGGGSFTSAGLNRRWSHEPIDLSALGLVDADISLISDAIIQDVATIENVQAKAVLVDRVVTVSQFQGTAYGGPISVVGVVKATDQLDLNIDFNAENIEINNVLHSAADFKRISGPLSVSGKLKSSGRSEADLVQTLAGKGAVKGVLKAKVKQEEIVGGALLGVLGSKLKAIQGVGGATTTLLQAFAGQPANLGGTYVVENGVLVSNDLRLDGRNASVYTAATIDLPAWLINSQSDMFRAGEDPTKPYITVHLTGPLDKPNPRVKGLFLQSKSKTIQQLLGGGTVEDNAPVVAPVDGASGQTETTEPVVEEKSKKKKAKELIKGILKGLGG
ncbi:AsmA family protein [Kiloniella antarctica]|uniref:AsmA family protein n=1 Tax=Kiloniella antarctica TaxID=1550907 RepID=A0ABW5BDE7_9PROT